MRQETGIVDLCSLKIFRLRFCLRSSRTTFIFRLHLPPSSALLRVSEASPTRLEALNLALSVSGAPSTYSTLSDGYSTRLLAWSREARVERLCHTLRAVAPSQLTPPHNITSQITMLHNKIIFEESITSANSSVGRASD
jgi:hypothetical protein